MSAPAPVPDPDPDAGRPLGPSSLTWARFGDVRTALLMLWAGTLQAMHPTISAALSEHSAVFDEPVARLLRSARPIARVVYEGDAAGREVRGFHDGVQGVDDAGRPYHALQGDPYFWAHATFVAMQYVVADRLGGDPLDDDARERLYRESVRWYASYGLSMRPVPTTYQDFCAFWDRTVAEVLVRSPAVDRSPLHRGDPGPCPFPGMPMWAWRIAGPAFLAVEQWVARGCWPEPVRERLGVRWTRRDERGFRVGASVLRGVFRVLPWRRRLVPVARAAYERAGTTPEGRTLPTPRCR